MVERIAKSLAFLVKHLGPLLGLTCLIYLPYFALYRGSVAAGILPEDAAAAGFGLLDLLIAPFAHGAAVFMMNRWADGESTTIAEGLAVAKGAWTRLIVTYIIVAFIMLGYLSVTVLPSYVVLQILKINQPLVLAPIVALVITYVMARYAFLDPLVVVDGMSPYHARARSKDLVKGHKLEILLLGLISYLPPMVIELGGEALTSGGGRASSELESLLAWSGPVSVLLYLWPQTLFFLYYRDLKFQYLNQGKEVA